MKQMILAVLILSTTLSSWAIPKSYQGAWCQKFDDFTTYFIINADESARMVTVGNQANEIAQDERGYVSFGATQHQVYLGGHSLGVNEMRLTRAHGSQYLVLSFQNGAEQFYKKCKAPNIR